MSTHVSELHSLILTRDMEMMSASQEAENFIVPYNGLREARAVLITLL